MDRKLLLLGILREREMHGYQLYEFIERDLATCTDLKKPTAYYILNKMAQDGWIDQEITQEGNRPLRKVYRLTPSGESAFQRLLRASLSTYQPATFSSSSSLAFLDMLERPEALDLLSQRRRVMTEMLDEMLAVPQHNGSMQLLIDHQVHHLQAELEWLDALLASLDNNEPELSPG